MGQEQPSTKRRKLQNRSKNSTPRYSSPDELGRDEYVPPSTSIMSRPSSSSGQNGKGGGNNSARRKPIRRRPRARSPSIDELHEAYYSRSENSHSPIRTAGVAGDTTDRRRPHNPANRVGRPRDRGRDGSRSGDDEESSRSRERREPSSGSRSRASSSRSRSRSRDDEGGSRSTSRRRRRRSRTDSRSRTSSRSRSPRSEDEADTRSRSRASTRSPSSPAKPAPYEPARPDFRAKFVLRGHTRAVSQVRVSPDGNFVASASADGTVRTWNAHTGAHIDTLVGHLAGISCLAWSPDSATIATGSDDKAIRLWDRVTGRPKMSAKGSRSGRASSAASSKQAVGGLEPMRPLLGHHNYIHCLAFSPKGNILASGSYDEAVFLWDVRAGRLMRSLPAHSDPVTGIDFSRDGTLVVSCSTDGLTRVWDTGTGQCLRTLVHEDNPAVTSVCFSPNGRFVLAFTLDNCIRMWDYVSGSVKKTYQGHKNEKFSIGGCFGVWSKPTLPPPQANGEGDATGETLNDASSSNQAFIASASEDGSIVLWDVKSKAVVQELRGAHDGVCFWVDVRGGLMVSAGGDGTIKVYRDKSQQPQLKQQEAAPASDAAPTTEESTNAVEREKLAEKVADLEVEDREHDDAESVDMTADVQIKMEEAEAEAADNGEDVVMTDGP